jgi:ribosomal protein S18 acetylase RimI-like enzyme
MTDSSIEFTSSAADVSALMLHGFFVDWPHPPSPATHLELLRASFAVQLAIADDRVVGFITAISDGMLSAYIPLLEVLPEYHGRGIGSELVRRMLDQLGHLYMVDVLCDDEVAPFYERIGGLQRAGGFIARNYAAQSGAVT